MAIHSGSHRIVRRGVAPSRGLSLLALVLTIVLTRNLGAAPGDDLERIPSLQVSPQDITWDGTSYYMTILLGGQILQVSEDLQTLVREIPAPFNAGELLTGIAFDRHDNSIWVASPQSREIAEIELLDDTETRVGRVLAPAFLPVVNPLAQPSIRGMAFHPGGDGGDGSLFVVESLGTQIYEISLDGDILRRFDHRDDPDGFPGGGASAQTSDIDLILDEDEQLTGFYVNGFDRASRREFLRRLDVDGTYTGFSIPLHGAAGPIDGFLFKPFRVGGEDGELIDPAVLTVVGCSAEIAILDGTEPPIAEIHGLLCTVEERAVTLSWTTHQDYDRVEVLRDGRIHATVDGTSDRFVDTDVSQGVHRYQVRAHDEIQGETLTRDTGVCSVVIGPGRVVRSVETSSEVNFDLAIDADDHVLVSDFFLRSVLVFTSDLQPAQDVPLQEIPVLSFTEEDRLSGLAFRPDTGNILVYNRRTNVVTEIDYFGDVSSQAPFEIRLPNDPNDPADEANVVSMDYHLANDDESLIWLLEFQRAMIYEVGFEGEIRREFAHPDLKKVVLPDELDFSPFTSGLTLVPGSDGRLLDLTGGTIRDREAVRIFRFDTETEDVVPGIEISLEHVDQVCPHTYLCIARHPGEPERLFASTIQVGNSHVLEIDGAVHELKPITDLACAQVDLSTAVRLSFSANDEYDRVEVFRNGDKVADLAGDATGFVDAELAPGVYRYQVSGVRGALSTDLRECELRVGSGALLERDILPVPSPGQLDVDPLDGTLWLSQNGGASPTSIIHLDENLQTTEILRAVVPPGFSVATFAVRREPLGSREIYVIGKEQRVALNADQAFLLVVVDETGAPIRELSFNPPSPENGFVTFPTGLAWDEETDTFHYLERNSDTLVQMGPDGASLRDSPNPVPPKQCFVFNTGLDVNSSGIFVTTAAAADSRITRIDQLTPGGRPTGLTVPLDSVDMHSIDDIAILDHRIALLGSTGSLPEIVTVEGFDPIGAPGDLACEGDATGSVRLSWSIGDAFDELTLYRDGEELTRLAGSTTSYDDDDTAWSGVRVYALRGSKGTEEGPIAVCEITRSVLFSRGDADLNGTPEPTDAIVILFYQFRGGGDVRCFDAADADDSGDIALNDPILLLSMLFLGTGPLPPPFPEVGEDPTADELGCTGLPGRNEE